MSENHNFQVVHDDFSINLPIVDEQIYRNGSYVRFGEDNLFPQYLTELYHNSPVHSSILNTKINLTMGDGLFVKNLNDVHVNKLETFYGFSQNINRKGETLNDVFKKITKDYIIFGYFALEIIYTRDYSKIAEVYHKDASKIRAGQLNQKKQVKRWFYNFDWQNERRHKTEKLPPYNPNRKQPKQLYVYGDYTPNLSYYSLPDYVSALSWAELDKELADFSLNHVANGLSPSKMLNFNEGKPQSEEEKRDIYNRILKDFTGSKGNKLFLSFNDSPDNAPSITDIGSSEVESQLEQLNNLILQNLVTSHGLTNPQLAGIKTSGELGSNKELMESEELFKRKVINGYQKSICDTLTAIFNTNDYGIELGVKDSELISEKFSEDTLQRVLTKDELRERIGYEPLENNDNAK